jgi:hypothetical protein
MGRGAESEARAARLRNAGRSRSRASHLLGFRGLAALGLVCLSAFPATQADAEVAVVGGPDDMHVKVENDTVGHVLETLSRNENLHFRSATPLNKVIGGSFSGSLGQVLSRILIGFDFVVRYSSQGVEVFVFRESGAAPIPSQPIEASPTAETASPAPNTAAVGINPSPRYGARHAPSQYDLSTAARIPTFR